jgi:transposase
MTVDSSALPNDVETLQALLREQAMIIARQGEELRDVKAELTATHLKIEQLEARLAKLRRLQFGQSSEKLSHEIEQLELLLEDLEERAATKTPLPVPSDRMQKPHRRPLPEALPREEIVHETACTCPQCGGELRRFGEDVTEVLEYVPGSFKVIRHVRPKFSCRRCEAITQASLPSQPIERGRPGAGLLAHVLVSKYADHLPLYRQSEIYARQGIELERSTLADWVGRSTSLLEPLVEALSKDVMASDVLHGDDTPVPVLDPGRGKTKTGRLWTYVRDERPHSGIHPPAAVYFYSPDRKGEHPAAHLKSFKGVLHADGYAGFAAIFERGAITEAACWAHVRRKFFDEHVNNGSPIAKEALDRIGALYGIEEEARGKPPDHRRRLRQEKSKLLTDALHAWLAAMKPKLSPKSDLAAAIRYALSRWKALTRFLIDGRLEIDNNAAERAIRPLALGRKNYLFAGSDAGGERAAAIYSLITTAKLNGLDPEAYLRHVISCIADHPINRIADLLPWNGASANQTA